MLRFERIGAVRFRALPFPPMSRAHVQPFLGFQFHPSAGDAPAWEYERMRAIVIDDSQLKVAVERRAGYMLPHIVII